jgi:hypothetical protein
MLGIPGIPHGTGERSRRPHHREFDLDGPEVSDTIIVTGAAGGTGVVIGRLLAELMSSNSPTLARMIFCSVVMWCSPIRRGGRFTTLTTSRPASAIVVPWGQDTTCQIRY